MNLRQRRPLPATRCGLLPPDASIDSPPPQRRKSGGLRVLTAPLFLLALGVWLMATAFLWARGTVGGFDAAWNDFAVGAAIIVLALLRIFVPECFGFLSVVAVPLRGTVSPLVRSSWYSRPPPYRHHHRVCRLGDQPAARLDEWSLHSPRERSSCTWTPILCGSASSDGPSMCQVLSLPRSCALTVRGFPEIYVHT
jgi:hypothetical protein